MLTEKQIFEIREHLEKAQNPVFLYDNDADGFCSYILLRRAIERGKGVIIRSHPDVDEKYAKKVQELNADYIFVLDRPILGEKFVEEAGKLQIPVVWIDHHDFQEKEVLNDNVFVYNPTHGDKKSAEPVAYWCYKIANKKEDSWISVMGCIADHHMPDFINEFEERYSELWGKNIKKPFDAYYKTEIGKLARVIGFSLKDSLTHVVQLQNYLINCPSPRDMLDELESTKPFAKKYKEIAKKYKNLLNKAKKLSKEKIIFFNYGGDLSISSDISNELSYLYPEKLIVVAYSSGPITNISMRGKNVRGLIEKIIKTLEKASGGGHSDAIGARIQTKDLEKFKSEIEKEISKE